jgi:hypothetical protein
LGIRKARLPCWFFTSISEQLPQWRSGAIEEALHPTAPTSRIVIFANRLAGLRFGCAGPDAALADLHVATLVARLQLAVEAEFHAESLASHASLHLGARDLVAMAGQGESVVVADYPFFHVSQNGGQVQLWR